MQNVKLGRVLGVGPIGTDYLVALRVGRVMKKANAMRINKWMTALLFKRKINRS